MANIEKIEQIAKMRGFIYPSAEIYGGLSGFYDFGHLGFKLKTKIENFWREFFLKQDDIIEIKSTTIAPESVFRASGHLDSFVDPLTQCKKCKGMFRTDTLIEEKTGKFVEGMITEELTKVIKENNVRCPKCKGELDDAKVFNLMLKTTVGPVEGNIAYLRPETAQGIFTNFSFIARSARSKLPFGIAQMGTSYRNEISPRQWIIRVREFNQMEIEMFINPKKMNDCSKFGKVSKEKLRMMTQEAQKKKGDIEEMTAAEAVDKGIVPNKWMAYFMAKQMIFYQKLGIPFEALRHRHMTPEETPHYSKGNFDLEIKLDIGWKETVGNAYRTDYDLKNHSQSSGKDMTIMDDNEKVLPHVIEPSFGLERTIYGILLNCFVEDKERGWDWFKFPARIAPYTVCVFPLVKKDGLQEKSREVSEMLKKSFDVFFDPSGSIGRRYARADEIGTPFCVTIDYDTMDDSTVTVRDRDTTEQQRVKIDDLEKFISNKIE
ncbi:MAG: glycine--tRNA ligase [Candidatus Aenigmatarchaeota archaeon]